MIRQRRSTSIPVMASPTPIGPDDPPRHPPSGFGDVVVKIYVGNLSFQSTEADVNELFSQHGEVSDVTLLTDRDTGRPRGFGFVEMTDDNAARDAISALDGKEFGGRQLKVNEARPREDRRGGGGGGRGGQRNRW
jgi:cold-inducible RNA-binding protein